MNMINHVTSRVPGCHCKACERMEKEEHAPEFADITVTDEQAQELNTRRKEYAAQVDDHSRPIDERRAAFRAMNQADRELRESAEKEADTMQTTTKPITEGYRATLIALYKRTGGHFFDADSMRFFNSCVSERVYQVGNHNQPEPAQYVFVTSEKDEGNYYSYSQNKHVFYSEPRKYTVRHWDGTSTSIDSVPDFQAFDNREAAHKAAKQYAEEIANQ